MSRIVPFAALMMLLPSLAFADPAADAASCQQAAGTLLVGTVQDGPWFKSGKALHGVFLSHTHVTLIGDDGKTYDVAMDNVFANGYVKNQSRVPAPLNTIKVGDRLELCGQPYTGGDVGIHWVHTNCGATPSPDKPNGWVRLLGANDVAGDNMEANRTFCGLWPN
jgi:hypothetical protein